VPAHKWADISDSEYGMALMNDSKYGYRITGNSMELTLIRSGWLPDRKSDVGSHSFTYSILPHKGGWQDAGVVKEGYLLNNPAYVVPAHVGGSGLMPESYSLLSCDNSNVAFSAIKLAEDDSGIVTRLYNNLNEPTKAVLTCGFTPTSAIITDFLENPSGERCRLDGKNILLDLKPNEIVSIKINAMPL